MLDQIKKTGNLDIIDNLYSVDYDRIPVPPRVFLEDDYYLGQFAKKLSERWKIEFDAIFGMGSTISTVLITGAIGTGKSTFASVCIARKLYELSCLRTPAEFYGLLPGSKIITGIYNITLDKADDVLDKVRSYVDGSPYFLEKCPRRLRPNVPLVFPTKQLEIDCGSLSTHALGDNTLSFILDEANFYKAANSDAPTQKTRAHQLFNEARSRMVSRFMRHGRLPGLVILMSSRKFVSSFLDTLIERAKTDVEEKRITRVIELALWETKPPTDFCGEKFEVLIGTEQYASRVLEEEELVPEEAEVVEVPSEYLHLFKEDPDLALRDIAGVSTLASSAYFRDQSKIMQCIDPTRVHPFSREEITLTFGHDHQLEDFFNERALCKIEHSAWIPLVHPEAPRFIHLDLAYSGECLGMSMAHPCLMPTGQLGAYLDFMLRIRPPSTAGGEIDLLPVITFMSTLRSKGFQIKRITFDQFQSRLPIQLLIRAGFEAQLLSVQLIHYNQLKSCTYKGAVSMYEYGPFLDESKQLLRDQKGGRPHHPEGGLDDVSDSVASTVSQCFAIEGAVNKSSPKNAVRVGRDTPGSLVLAVEPSHDQEEIRG